MGEGVERSKASYAREEGSWFVVMTEDMRQRFIRLSTFARAGAGRGGNRQVLEDVNILRVLLLETPQSGAPATTFGDRGTLDLETELLTVTESAARLELSRQAITKACREGRLRAQHKGRDWVIRSDELEKFRYDRRRREQHGDQH